MEAGANKYDDRNWEKGQPVSVFMSSALRHSFKHLSGFDEEDHLAAAIWNLMGAAEMEERAAEGQETYQRMCDLPRNGAEPAWKNPLEAFRGRVEEIARTRSSTSSTDPTVKMAAS